MSVETLVASAGVKQSLSLEQNKTCDLQGPDFLFCPSVVDVGVPMMAVCLSMIPL